MGACLFANGSRIASPESAATAWSGRSGYLYQVIEEDFEDLNGTQIHLCGSPKMGDGTIDILKSIGLNVISRRFMSLNIIYYVITYRLVFFTSVAIEAYS